MAESITIREEIITDSKELYLLTIEAQSLEQEGVFELAADLRSNDRPFCNLKITLEITNPLIELGVVITAAKLYGICVASQSAMKMVDIVREAYKESKKELPDAGGRMERVYKVVAKLPDKSPKFKAAFKKYLKECLPKSLEKVLTRDSDGDK